MARAVAPVFVQQMIAAASLKAAARQAAAVMAAVMRIDVDAHLDARPGQIARNTLNLWWSAGCIYVGG